MNDYDLKSLPQEPKVLSLGEQIFNLLDGHSPEEKRKALMEAEERIHGSFDRKVQEAQESLKSIEEAWARFKK